jgi:hypothetical protein
MDAKILDLEKDMAELKKRMAELDGRYRIPETPYQSIFGPQKSRNA